MNDEESGRGYSIALSTSDDSPEDRDYFGEICTVCFETLRNWLLAPTDAALEKPNKSLSDGLHNMVQASIEAADDAEPAEIKALEPPKVKGDRGKIEEGELNVVKSRFDKAKANQAVRKTKGACAHHFKSFDDGKIVCGNAPPGFTGELSTFRGCGKVLTDAEL